VATDGAWITFETSSVTKPAGVSIQAINMDTGATLSVANNGSYNQRPNISGDLLTYESNVSGHFQIFLYRLAEGDTFQVTSSTYDERLNSVFGNLVTYVDDRTGNYDVYVSSLTFVTANPAISVVKSASITSFSAPGTIVNYSYKVTNTGNVTLTQVSVSDPMTGLSAVSCPVTTLAPGTSETCSATYTTTQADVSAGSIKNTCTATGAPATGANATATSTLTIPYQASLKLSVTPNSLPFGTVYQYSVQLKTVTVKNTGSAAVSITGVSVKPGANTDPYEFVSFNLCPRSLGVGKSCSIEIVLLADDLGAQSATLNITDNAAGSPQMVPMSATEIKRTFP